MVAKKKPGEEITVAGPYRVVNKSGKPVSDAVYDFDKGDTASPTPGKNQTFDYIPIAERK